MTTNLILHTKNYDDYGCVISTITLRPLMSLILLWWRRRVQEAIAY